MLINSLRRYFLASTNPNKPKTMTLRTNILESSKAILNERSKIRDDLKKQAESQVPVGSNFKRYQDSIVTMKFYMSHDDWRSQYMYLLMNYNQLGFNRVSDLAFLDRASYFLKLRNIREEQRWPSVKINIALDPAIILTGMDAISQFMRTNEYFTHQIDKQSSESVSLLALVDERVLPAMEALFWHPLLTWQYTFHTNQSSYEDTSGGYILFSVLGRNLLKVLNRSGSNLIHIAKNRQLYSQSKQLLTEALKQLATVYLSEQRPFFGGSKPSHVDFYLLSHLKTRETCKLFMDYLQHQIDKSFWAWWRRMGSLCQYNKDRVTLI